MPTDSCWLMFLLVVVLGWLASACWRRQPTRQRTTVIATQIQRLLKPRTPHDCPACRQQALAPMGKARTPPPVTPWFQIKSRRGAPKRINTQGFACPNRTCPYYRITDVRVHALVGDGSEGKIECVQTLRCQACTTTFSTRRDTPLYRLKTASHRVAEVLTSLSEGLDISAAARVFGHRQATIMTWLTRAGAHSATLHDHTFRDLQQPHVQLDEIRTRLRSRAHGLWLWLAIDPITKIVPVLHLGARTQDAAHAVIHELRQRLAPQCIPVFTSDGLNLYFYALTAHFGQWVVSVGRRARKWQVTAGLIYGQVKKVYRRRRLVRVTPVMRCGTRAALKVALRGLGLSGRLNTAFVERLNLTVRQSVAALVRRTWSTAQQAPELLLHLEWWRGYYHFARPHKSLRVELRQPLERGGKRLPQRYRQRTPAMAAGLVSRRWSVRDLLTLPLQPVSIGVG
jgi:transposase-like protein/IS1 family transposase